MKVFNTTIQLWYGSFTKKLTLTALKHQEDYGVIPTQLDLTADEYKNLCIYATLNQPSWATESPDTDKYWLGNDGNDGKVWPKYFCKMKIHVDGVEL